ncbi:MAG: hypothetical protein IH831_05805 [Planctomycetes bacterium]|nr:hypothetical protein [Planctomycetota bacterium]
MFNLPIDPTTFTVADVVELTGPSGPIVPTGVEQVSANEFDVVFDNQRAAGLYSLTIGPDIAATSGGTLDQDGDGAPGEVPDDRFATMFEVSPFTARFDFGSFGSPAEAGYVHVLPGDSYSAEVGYGYESGFVAAVDRFSGSNLERDIHYGSDFTFSVDAPDGLYIVVLTIGDRGPYAHESMGVFLEDQQIDTVSTAPGEVATFTYNDVAVAGGKFELRLLDLGGPDVNAVLAGLELSASIDLGDIENSDTLSADFDGDGFITGFDFLLWQLGFGTTAPDAIKTDGDADNDLDADHSDLDVWENQFGQPAPAVAATSSPVIETFLAAEPSTAPQVEVTAALTSTSEESSTSHLASPQFRLPANFIVRPSDLGFRFTAPQQVLVRAEHPSAEQIDEAFRRVWHSWPEQNLELASDDFVRATHGRSAKATQPADKAFAELADDRGFVGLGPPL